MHKRLLEIAARKQELIKELDGDVAQERIDEIEKEQRTLEAEETEIRKKMEVQSRLGNVVETPAIPNEGSAQERAAQQFVETRALTIASGQIAVPTATQNEINDTLISGNTILDQVDVQDCNGMGNNLVPYEIPSMEAGVDAEGASTTSEYKTAYAKISPVTVDIYTSVSREVMKLSPVRYMEAVQRAARKALRKKIAELIMVSDDAEAPTFFGINAAPACKLVQTIAKIDDTTLRTIVLAYGGDEDVEGATILMLTKEDLQAFGAIRGTNEKKAVYEISPDTANPNTGIIKDGGLSCKYVLNSKLNPLATATADDDVMYYGKPMAYEVDLFSDYQITVSEDTELKQRQIAILGEVMVGGNVTTYNGFTKIRKAV